MACSDHFVKAKPSSLYDADDPIWAPTLKLGYVSKGAPMSSSRHARFVEREAKRRQLKCIEVEKSVELEESQGQQTDTVEELKNKLSSISDKLSSTQTELHKKD